MVSRVAFVTIGQTPRVDLVPEIVAALPDGVEALEFGALDGLSDAGIADGAPSPGEPRLVTRLANGRQAVLGKRWMERRLNDLFGKIADEDVAATVLLCTGEFDSLHHPPGLFLEAQAIVDHGVSALALGARRIGVILPLEEQIEEFHYRPRDRQALLTSFASPYEGDRLDAAALELRDADLIVMHCMGYSEAMRARVARLAGTPVLLARRMVASALAQIL